jgi:transposase-like protein
VQAELESYLETPLGLRSLNEQVLAFKQAVYSIDSAAECPPVVVLDGVWASWMVETGESKPDSKRRLRKLKRKQKVVILVALGIWPDRKEWDILAWYIATEEDEANWTAFLSQLQESGLKVEAGLKLLIADGAGGIEAARQMVYGQKLPLQRCVFHKIRNVLRDVRCPQGLSREQKVAHKRKLTEDLAAIWEAESEAEALRRMEAVVDSYQAEQPLAMSTLQRDFEATVQFYRVQREAALDGKEWSAGLLRTSSLLERANREIRRAIRRGCAWPSEEGLGVRVWLGALGYRRNKGGPDSCVVYKAAEAALIKATPISP